MANTITNFLNTVAATVQSTKFTQDLAPHAAFLSCTTMNPVEPTVKAVNDVVNIPLPTLSGSWVDHQSSTVTAGDIANTPIAVTLNKTPTRTIKLTSQEISRMPESPALLQRTIGIALLELLDTASSSIGALFTTTNFDVTGNTNRTADTGEDYVTRAQLVNLWGVLATRKIPVSDTGNLFAVTHPTIYAKWTNDDDFTKASSIGDAYASAMRVSGNLVPINNLLPLYDSQAPTTLSGASYTTAVFHRNATWAQFAYPEAPLSNAVDYRYTVFNGIPVLMVLTYDTNLGATGGAFNTLTMSTLWNYGVGRKNHAVLDLTPEDAA